LIPDSAGPLVQSRPGLLTITDARLFAAGKRDAAALFARRILRFEEVQSLEIDPVLSKATLRYRVSAGGPEDFVFRFASALTEDEALVPDRLPTWRDGEPVTLYRLAGWVTSLQITKFTRNRIEARHPFLGYEAASSRQIEAALRARPGILHAAVADMTVRVRFDAALISSFDVVRLIESELPGPPDPHSAPETGQVEFGTANTSLGVTTVAEFILPVLTPVGAGLLVLNSFGTVLTATAEFRAGKIGLAALYTTILGTTLFNGQFFSAALMFWCFRQWEERYREDLKTETQVMLDETISVPQQAVVLTAEGQAKPWPRTEIFPGQRLRVRKGEWVPADAMVLEGVAVVDESTLRGDPVPAKRLAGDAVLAGTRLLAGELSLEATRIGEHTQAARVARKLVASTVPSFVPEALALNAVAESFADQIVAPTMFAAGLGLIAGDAGMAGAVLRPDYATGVGLVAPLESIRDARLALRHGALIASGDAMQRLAKSRWVVLEDHPDLSQADCELADIRRSSVPENQLLPAVVAAGARLGDPRGPALLNACRSRKLIARRADVREIDETGVSIDYGKRVLWLRGVRDLDGVMPLHVEIDGRKVAELTFRRGKRPAAAATVKLLQRAGMRVMLCSDRKQGVAPLARSLGVDRHQGGIDADSRIELLRTLGGGSGVVHVHPGEMFRTEGGHLSVAVGGWGGDADLVLFGRSIAPLPDLLSLSRDSVHRSGLSRRLLMVPNLFCVAGAFAFGLSGLAVVVISNFGTSMVYNRARRALQSVTDLNGWLPPENWRVEDEIVSDDGDNDTDPSRA
jgi:cation transport ATPase